MKRQNKLNCFKLWYFIPVVCIVLLYSCNNKWVVPAEYVGEWKTDKSKITVRTEPQRMKFIFTSDSADVYIKINNDKTITGFIGTAEITNGKMQKSWGLPSSVTGVSFTVACGSVGKIFNNDPLAHKQVELWLSPLKDNNTMEAELRYTENSADFPMATLLFKKVKNK